MRMLTSSTTISYGWRTNKELPRIPPVDVNLVSSMGGGGGGSVPVQETILE